MHLLGDYTPTGSLVVGANDMQAGHMMIDKRVQLSLTEYVIVAMVRGWPTLRGTVKRGGWAIRVLQRLGGTALLQWLLLLGLWWCRRSVCGTRRTRCHRFNGAKVSPPLAILVHALAQLISATRLQCFGVFILLGNGWRKRTKWIHIYMVTLTTLRNTQQWFIDVQVGLP